METGRDFNPNLRQSLSPVCLPLHPIPRNPDERQGDAKITRRLNLGGLTKGVGIQEGLPEEG